MITETEVIDALRDPRFVISNENIRTAWELLRQRMRNNEALATMQFRVGDDVQFDAKGFTWTGAVTKVNQKSVSVRATHIGRVIPVDYKVPPSMLRKAAA